MKFNYLLCDNGGMSTAYDQEIIIPIGTNFLHEYGLYTVVEYRDKDGNPTRKTDKIKMVDCERIKTNEEIKKALT